MDFILEIQPRRAVYGLQRTHIYGSIISLLGLACGIWSLSFFSLYPPAGVMSFQYPFASTKWFLTTTPLISLFAHSWLDHGTCISKIRGLNKYRQTWVPVVQYQDLVSRFDHSELQTTTTQNDINDNNLHINNDAYSHLNNNLNVPTLSQRTTKSLSFLPPTPQSSALINFAVKNPHNQLELDTGKLSSVKEFNSGIFGFSRDEYIQHGSSVNYDFIPTPLEFTPNYPTELIKMMNEPECEYSHSLMTPGLQYYFGPIFDFLKSIKILPHNYGETFQTYPFLIQVQYPKNTTFHSDILLSSILEENPLPQKRILYDSNGKITLTPTSTHRHWQQEFTTETRLVWRSIHTHHKCDSQIAMFEQWQEWETKYNQVRGEEHSDEIWAQQPYSPRITFDKIGFFYSVSLAVILLRYLITITIVPMRVVLWFMYPRNLNSLNEDQLSEHITWLKAHWFYRLENLVCTPIPWLFFAHIVVISLSYVLPVTMLTVPLYINVVTNVLGIAISHHYLGELLLQTQGNDDSGNVISRTHAVTQSELQSAITFDEFTEIDQFRIVYTQIEKLSEQINYLAFKYRNESVQELEQHLYFKQHIVQLFKQRQLTDQNVKKESQSVVSNDNWNESDNDGDNSDDEFEIVNGSGSGSDSDVVNRQTLSTEHDGLTRKQPIPAHVLNTLKLPAQFPIDDDITPDNLNHYLDLLPIYYPKFSHIPTPLLEKMTKSIPAIEKALNLPGLFSPTRFLINNKTLVMFNPQNTTPTTKSQHKFLSHLTRPNQFHVKTQGSSFQDSKIPFISLFLDHVGRIYGAFQSGAEFLLGNFLSQVPQYIPRFEQRLMAKRHHKADVLTQQHYLIEYVSSLSDAQFENLCQKVEKCEGLGDETVIDAPSLDKVTALIPITGPFIKNKVYDKAVISKSRQILTQMRNFKIGDYERKILKDFILDPLNIHLHAERTWVVSMNLYSTKVGLYYYQFQKWAQEFYKVNGYYHIPSFKNVIFNIPLLTTIPTQLRKDMKKLFAFKDVIKTIDAKIITQINQAQNKTHSTYHPTYLPIHQFKIHRFFIRPPTSSPPLLSTYKFLLEKLNDKFECSICLSGFDDVIEDEPEQSDNDQNRDVITAIQTIFSDDSNTVISDSPVSQHDSSASDTDISANLNETNTNSDPIAKTAASIAAQKKDKKDKRAKKTRSPYSNMWALQCGHVFHKACICAWLSRRSLCPNDTLHICSKHETVHDSWFFARATGINAKAFRSTHEFLLSKFDYNSIFIPEEHYNKIQVAQNEFIEATAQQYFSNRFEEHQTLAAIIDPSLPPLDPTTATYPSGETYTNIKLSILKYLASCRVDKGQKRQSYWVDDDHTEKFFNEGSFLKLLSHDFTFNQRSVLTTYTHCSLRLKSLQQELVEEIAKETAEKPGTEVDTTISPFISKDSDRLAVKKQRLRTINEVFKLIESTSMTME